MVKNPPANARDTGSIPEPGRSHGISEQLNLRITTPEPQLESPWAAATEACTP